MNAPASVRSQLTPLAIAAANALLSLLAGLVGGAGMLWNGEWFRIVASLLAAALFPLALFGFHWLRLVFDIPAMFARDARANLLAGILDYLSDVFVHMLVLGWLALVFWWLNSAPPSIFVFFWGFAVVSGPLLAVIFRPLGYPMLAWACVVAQLLWPVAWGCARYQILSIDNILYGIGATALISPLIGFSPRWQAFVAPD